LLRPLFLGALLVPGWLLAIPLVLESRRAGRAAAEAGEAQPALAGAPPQGERLLALALVAFTGLLALATLFSALKPPDALAWASLSYHLAVPAVYLREGRISLLVYDSHSDFPFTMEMLCTLGLAFAGAGGAKLFHWAAAWLAAAAVGIWTSRLVVAG